MNKISGIKKSSEIADITRKKGRLVILTGGCFDILHIGHIRFLEEAKKLGGNLFILLESDKKVKELKGKNRPIFSQKERAHTLASLVSVDHIIMLPPLANTKYLEIIEKIKPDIIAAAQNDRIIEIKRNQAEKVAAKLIILPYFKSLSSTKIASLLAKEDL